MKIADGPVTLERNGDPSLESDAGYIRWRDYHHSYKSGQQVCYVHQLCSIANGADPHEVFSDGEFETHHKCEHPRLNWPENLVTVHHDDHFTHHIHEPSEVLTDAVLDPPVTEIEIKQIEA